VLKKPFVTFDLNIKLNKVKLKESDNINVNMVKELNNIILDVLIESNNATV
jgi:hypothetical protein